MSPAEKHHWSALRNTRTALLPSFRCPIGRGSLALLRIS